MRAAVGVVLLALVLLGHASSAGAQGVTPRPAASPAEAAEANRLRELARDLQGPPRTFRTDPTDPGGGAGGGGTAPPPPDPPAAQEPPPRPGTPPMWLLWAGIGLLVVVAALVVWFVVRRRTRGAEPEAQARAVAAETEAERLEREAAEAEARGEHAAAVRLRFRAGVLRLRASEALGPLPATAQDVAAAVPVPEAKGLVADLEAVAYAGRTGTAEASGAARAGWPVVDEAGRRGGAR